MYLHVLVVLLASAWTMASPLPYKDMKTHSLKVRGKFWGVVHKVPSIWETRHVERDDIFLARALEDSVIATAQDTLPSLTGALRRLPDISIGTSVIALTDSIANVAAKKRDEESSRKALITYIDTQLASRSLDERRRLVNDLSLISRSLEKLTGL